jgi:hypothetical protein
MGIFTSDFRPEPVYEVYLLVQGERYEGYSVMQAFRRQSSALAALEKRATQWRYTKHGPEAWSDDSGVDYLMLVTIPLEPEEDY